MRAALALPAFRPLLGAYAISQLGDWAAEVALAVLVYGLTGDPRAVAATWLVHRCLLGVGAPLLVARADRRDPRVLLPAIALLQGMIFAALAAGSSIVGIAGILALAATDGLLAPVSRALMRSTIARVTGPAGLLREGNAALNVAFTTNAMLAAALGGVLTAALGPSVALALNTATFLAVAALLRTSPMPRVPQDDDAAAAGATSAWRSLVLAVHYVRTTPPLGLLLLADAAFMAFALTISPVEVVLVRGTLHASSAALGIVLGAWGIGMIVGGTLVGRAERRSGYVAVLAVGVAAQAVAFLGMGLSGTVLGVAAFSAVGGVGNGLYGVLLMTSVQQRTSSAFQARVAGLIEALITAATAFAFIAGGTVATVAGPRPVYLLAGIGSLAVLAVTAARLRVTTARPDPASRPISATA